MPFSRWIRDSDVSAGMNNSHTPHLFPLPLFSTSCLQSFASLFITTATSEDIFTFLLTPPPPPPPLLPYAKEGIISPLLLLLPRCPPVNPPLYFNSFFSSWIRTQCWIHCHLKFYRVPFAEMLCTMTQEHILWAFNSADICTENGLMCWCTHLIIQSWEWEVQPLTRFDSYIPDWQQSLEGKVLTDKMADKAEEKLPNQNLE